MTTTKNTAKKTAKGSTEPYVICRCRDAGVHAGYLVGERAGRLTLRDSRRIWYWNGAASLSEIAVYGCSREGSRIAALVARNDLRSSDVCEIIYCQPAGIAWLQGAPVWRA